MPKTSKKVKVQGTQTYINKDTGELIEMEVISIEERDANFHKIWLYQIADSLDLIGNQKTKVLFHIINNLNADNIFIGTQKDISTKLSLSSQTVSLTLKKLQESNFLKQQHHSVYVVNPDFLFKGKADKRLNILLAYSSLAGKGTKTNEDEQVQQTDEKSTKNTTKTKKATTKESSVGDNSKKPSERVKKEKTLSPNIVPDSAEEAKQPNTVNNTKNVVSPQSQSYPQRDDFSFSIEQGDSSALDDFMGEEAEPSPAGKHYTSDEINKLNFGKGKPLKIK